MKKFQDVYNVEFRIVLKLPRWTSASHMFVFNNVSSFHAEVNVQIHGSVKLIKKWSHDGINPAYTKLHKIFLLFLEALECMYLF